MELNETCRSFAIVYLETKVRQSLAGGNDVTYYHSRAEAHEDAARHLGLGWSKNYFVEPATESPNVSGERTVQEMRDRLIAAGYWDDGLSAKQIREEFTKTQTVIGWARRVVAESNRWGSDECQLNEAIRSLSVALEVCLGCGADHCRRLWPEGKKCCPDCSHK